MNMGNFQHYTNTPDYLGNKETIWISIQIFWLNMQTKYKAGNIDNKFWYCFSKDKTKMEFNCFLLIFSFI